MRRSVTVLAPLWAVVLCLCAGVVNAGSIDIQNANFSAGASKVVVTGKLIGFGQTNTVTIKDTMTGELLAELAGVKKNFNVQIDRGEDQAVPCSVTVSSGEETASREVRHTPADCSNRFILSGIVTDSALPYATVVVHVGGQTFTTVADASGFYSLEIAATTVGDLVTIEAEAANPNDPGETVNFVNLAGTFSKLLSDPIENVTNVTTAQFVLLVAANAGQAPTTKQELRDAETHVDATRLLEIAAVIKLIVDDPATYPLPVGFDSIIEFIADAAAVDQFIADVNATDPDAITDTIVAILTDNDLVEGFTAAGIPSFYYAIPRAVPGYLSRGGGALEFDDSNFDGTMLAIVEGGSGLPVSEEFNWLVIDGVLELSFTNPTPTSGISYPQDFTSDQGVIDEYWDCAVSPDAGITTHGRLLASSYTRVVDGSLVDIASRTDRLESSFDDVPTNDFPEGCTGDPMHFDTLFEFSTYEYTLRSSADITPVPFTDGPVGVDVLGSWAFQYYYNRGADLFNPSGRRVLGNLLTFNAGGAGTKLFDDEDLTDQTFSWQIVGNDLVISYPDGWTQTSRILDQKGKQYGVFSDFTNGTDRFANYEIVIKQDPSFAFTESYLLSPTGKFWNSVINHWVPGFDFVDGSWRFESRWGWDFDPLPNGTHPQAYEDEGVRYWTEVTMTWEILPDGMLRRNYVAASWVPERQRFWTPLAEDPIIEDPMTGEPMVPAMRRFYVLEYENQDPDRRIQPRINIQQEQDIPEYDIYELCTPVPVWNCTTTP